MLQFRTAAISLVNICGDKAAPCNESLGVPCSTHKTEENACWKSACSFKESVKCWSLWTIDSLLNSVTGAVSLSSKTWSGLMDLTRSRCLKVECQHQQAFSWEESEKERKSLVSPPLRSPPMVRAPTDSGEWNLWHLPISRSFQEGCREDNEASWEAWDQGECRPQQEAAPLVRTHCGTKSLH